MTAFETAWKIMKAPFHGTDYDSAAEILSHGMKPNSFAAGFEGEKGVPKQTRTREDEAMHDAWSFALANVLASGKPSTPSLLWIDPNHPAVRYKPDNRPGMEVLGQKGHLFSEDEIPRDAIEQVFDGDEYDPDGVEAPEDYEARMIEMLEESI
jgi:hypothetical protein